MKRNKILKVFLSLTCSQCSCLDTSGELLTPIGHLFGVVVGHTGGIIHGQHNLVLPLARLGPPEPDLVLSELAGDVRDDLPHV